MRLLRLRSAWGLAGLRSGDRQRTFAAVRAAGFDGVEASLGDIGGSIAERRACLRAAQAEDQALVLSAYSSWQSYEGAFEVLPLSEHIDRMRAELDDIAELCTSLVGPSPVWRVNAHSGSDMWSDAEACDFFTTVAAHAAAVGQSLPPVSHETHRGRFLCCPFATARILETTPTLRLTSDFSHWVIKCERLLDSPEESEFLATAIAPAVDHIHARIGTPQAPQVADATHPSVHASAERHYQWWETVWSAREASTLSGRDATLTATVEYGPVEMTSGGEYCGYTPVDLAMKPVAGVDLDVTLRAARDGLEQRFERWHANSVERRFSI